MKKSTTFADDKVRGTKGDSGTYGGGNGGKGGATNATVSGALSCRLCRGMLAPEWMYCIVCGTPTASASSGQRNDNNNKRLGLSSSAVSPIRMKQGGPDSDMLASSSICEGSVGSTVTMSLTSDMYNKYAKYYKEIPRVKPTPAASKRQGRRPKNQQQPIPPIDIDDPTYSFISDQTKELLSQAQSLIEHSDENTTINLMAGKTLEQKVDFLEMMNSLSLESAYESLSHPISTSFSVNTTGIEPSMRRRANNQPRKRSNDNDDGYLDEVGSVSAYYEQVVQREKELIGLNSACLDELTVPEEAFDPSTVAMLWTDTSRLNNRPPTASDTVEDEGEECDEDGTEVARNIAEQSALNEGAVMLWTDVLLKNRPLTDDWNNDDDFSDEEDDEAPAVIEELPSRPLTAEEKRDKLVSELMSDLTTYAAKVSGKSPPRSPVRTAGEDGSLTIAAWQEDLSNNHVAGGGKRFPCFSIISKLYLNSCKQMKTTQKENEFRFSDVAMFNKHSLAKLGACVHALQTTLNDSLASDDRAQDEFIKFQDTSKMLRSEAAMRVSEALQLLSDTSHEYSEQYDAAKRAFDERSKHNVGFVSATGRHIVSDAKMEEIKRNADREQSIQGQRVQELQAEEAALALQLRLDRYARDCTAPCELFY
jgi:hypothetical protein